MTGRSLGIGSRSQCAPEVLQVHGVSADDRQAPQGLWHDTVPLCRTHILDESLCPRLHAVWPEAEMDDLHSELLQRWASR